MTLSSKEQRRLMVLNQLGAGALVNSEAAALLGLSVRQVRRLRGQYGRLGAAALSHGNRGRRPVNAVDAATSQKVVELASGRYAGFNHQHLTEMLAEQEQIQLSRSTVHRILATAGMLSPRRHRSPRRHHRRDRFPREGMLLQIDASRHDWLEGRGPYLSLVGAIDDATGLVPWACFREQEDAEGYFELLRQTLRRKGLPLALYSDRHGSFFKTKDKELSLEEQMDGRRHPTQFGRLLSELGVQLILARSPQAKGRVERLWGTFQDRLTSELRLAGAVTKADADQVLSRYLPRHNRRFTVPANDATPAWLPPPDWRRLDQLFCFKYRRVVANDHTVSSRLTLSISLPAALGPATPGLKSSCAITSTAPSLSFSRTAASARNSSLRKPLIASPPTRSPPRWSSLRNPPQSRPVDPNPGDLPQIIPGAIIRTAAESNGQNY